MGKKPEKEIYVGSLAVPHNYALWGLERIEESLLLRDKGNQLILKVVFDNPDRKPWNPDDDQFIDQYIGQDETGRKWEKYSIDLVTSLNDKGSVIESEDFLRGLEKKAVIFQSGARGEIIVDDQEKVYLHYFPTS